MTDSVTQFIRQSVIDMKPYTPILPFEVLSQQLRRPIEQIIKLDANENPYGPSPASLAALNNLSAILPIYPDPEARTLRAKLADFLGVDMAHILMGAGADELIDLIMRLFLNPGDTIIDCPPTFSMYAFDAALSDAKVIQVWRRPDFSLDIDGIENAVAKHDAKILFITTPNNPDGSLLPRDQLEQLLRLPVIIVLDEAYIEFSGVDSTILRVPTHPNLIVLRTFSKWAGLAGLRIGYGVFPLALMEHLWKIKQPYNVNVAADAAAQAALDDITTLEERAHKIIAERQRLQTELAAFDFLDPYPSHSNFVLCKVNGRDAAQLKQELAEQHGILIRYFAKPGLDDHIRITAGKPEHTDTLLAALKQL